MIMMILLAIIIIVFLICLKFGYVNFNSIFNKNVRIIKNYCRSSCEARLLYNEVVNFFEANSDKLQCIKVKFDYWSDAVIVKYKSLDNKTVFTFDMVKESRNKYEWINR